MDWVWRLSCGVSGEELRLALRHYWQSHRTLILRLFVVGILAQEALAVMQMQDFVVIPPLQINELNPRAHPWFNRIAWSGFFPLIFLAVFSRLPRLSNYPLNPEAASTALPRKISGLLLCLSQALMASATLLFAELLLLSGQSAREALLEIVSYETLDFSLRFLLPGLIVITLLDKPLARQTQFQLAAWFWSAASIAMSITDFSRVPYDIGWRQMAPWVSYVSLAVTASMIILLLIRPLRCAVFCTACVLTSTIYVGGWFLMLGKGFDFWYCLAHVGLPTLGLFPERDLISLIVGVVK